MTHLQIEQLFDSFAGKRILIIGDVMVDSYLWGKVDRISPEAPVPVVACTRREDRLGGAANVALNIKSLGAIPILCALTGNDSTAEIFQCLLAKEKLAQTGIIADPSRSTTRKTRVISGNQQLLRVDEEDTRLADLGIEKQLIERIDSILKNEKIHAVVFQDYDKGTISPALIQHVTENCNAHNIPVLIDPKKRNFKVYKNATVFKPNFREFCEGLKTDLKKTEIDGIVKIAHHFLEESGHQYLMLTLSEKGLLLTNGFTHHVIPAHVRDIADVSGAGDTVISVAALCFAAGVAPPVAARIVNLAGGLVCEKVGVVPIDKSQLFRECLTLDFTN